MPHTIWTGAISFGLVHVPVRLISAVQEDSIDFHLLEDDTGQRIHYRKVNDEGEDVDDEDIIKGYEVEPDEWVVVSPEELEDLAAERSQTIEIDEFVELSDIDPIYYDRPYYLTPDQEADRPYKLLLKALEETGRVGIGKFVLHDREHLAALRPLNGVLCLVWMRFAEEVRPTEKLNLGIEDTEVDEDELDAAVELIETMTEEFDPSDYADEYKERVRELLEAKAEGEEFVVPEGVEKPVPPESLLEALKESLEQAKAGS